jgi:hypothetical protein
VNGRTDENRLGLGPKAFSQAVVPSCVTGCQKMAPKGINTARGQAQRCNTGEQMYTVKEFCLFVRISTRHYYRCAPLAMVHGLQCLAAGTSSLTTRLVGGLRHIPNKATSRFRASPFVLGCANVDWESGASNRFDFY